MTNFETNMKRMFNLQRIVSFVVAVIITGLVTYGLVFLFHNVK